MFKFVYIFLCILLLCGVSLQQDFDFPEATIDLLYPKGFSVSIPDQPGISLFAFHGKRNEDFVGREGGFYSRDITQAKNGLWTFTDTETKFKIGDKIYYWLYVDYFNGRNKLGYQSNFREYVVKECHRKATNDNGICNAPDPDEYDIPDAKVEILEKRGFKVSIPDHEGIQLFAFHGKINKDFNGREAGQFAKDITASANGRWTFVDYDTKFNVGDILYYWLYVIHRRNGNDIGYLKEYQKYVITDTSPDVCPKSVTTWQGNDVCSGQLLFNEDFLFLNSNNWRKEIKFADEPDYEFVIYDQFDENLNVNNGELHIKPILSEDKFGKGFMNSLQGYDLGDRCTADIPNDCKRRLVGGNPLPPVFSAKLSSTAYFKYGRVDIRAKLPKGDWIYPQLTLTPRRYEYGENDYDSGQIRIAFVGGNDNLNRELQGMLMLGTSPYARMLNIKKSQNPNEGWSNNYHTYSTVWKPDGIKFLVDNREYGEIMKPTDGFARLFATDKQETAQRWARGGNMAPFDKEMILQIGVGVGGHSFPDTISGKPYTNIEGKPHLKFYNKKYIWGPTWNQPELIVDFIKIYAL